MEKINFEKTFGESMQEVSANESVAKAIALASMLSIPMFASAEKIQAALPKDKVEYTKNDIKDVMQRVYEIKGDFGGLCASNLCNAVAKTLWDEARGKNEGTDGRKAVLSVILNRSGDNPSNTPSVLSKYLAFSGWNSYTGGWDDDTYVFFVPSTIKTISSDNEIWRECNELASKFILGEFKSTIGKFNSFINKKTADKKNVDTWGKKCNLKIGSHHFGYLPENDGFPQRPTITVIVKSGDTLNSLAKEHDTTVEDILQKNKKIKNRDDIKVGQKIRIQSNKTK